mmetsp:Transcript_38602/g.70210  ORF Transcript_38602/g.70210 Transcript_38602/m.70210 type:complete len:135 (+) Transcript_38602:47-451(+)
MPETNSWLRSVSQTLRHRGRSPASVRLSPDPDYLSDDDSWEVSAVGTGSGNPSTPRSVASLRSLEAVTASRSGTSSRYDRMSSIVAAKGSASNNATSKSKTAQSSKRVTICEHNNTNALELDGQIFEFAATSEV